MRNFFFGTFPTGKPLGAKDVGPTVALAHVFISGKRTGRRKNFTQLGDGMMDGPVYLGATVQWAFLAM